jgi:uncharacterized SAM-binding protein YcdF (DUF218 family)
MRCFFRCLINFVVLIAIAAVAAIAVAPQISEWLSRSDAPQPADAIIVLASDVTRTFEGAELYRAGFAKRVYLTVPRRIGRYEELERAGVPIPWFEEAGKTVLVNRGVPAEAIGTLGKDLRSTFSEARVVREALGATAKRIIVTTSPAHVHRARMIFRDELPGIEVLVIANRYESFPRDWWTDPDMARHVVLEIVQTIFYLVGGRFP